MDARCSSAPLNFLQSPSRHSANPLTLAIRSLRRNERRDRTRHQPPTINRPFFGPFPGVKCPRRYPSPHCPHRETSYLHLVRWVNYRKSVVFSRLTASLRFRRLHLTSSTPPISHPTVTRKLVLNPFQGASGPSRHAESRPTPGQPTVSRNNAASEPALIYL